MKPFYLSVLPTLEYSAELFTELSLKKFVLVRSLIQCDCSSKLSRVHLLM